MQHLRNTLFLRIYWFRIKDADSSMNFVSLQNSWFASLGQKCVFQVSRPYLGFGPNPKHFVVNCEQNIAKCAEKKWNM